MIVMMKCRGAETGNMLLRRILACLDTRIGEGSNPREMNHPGEAVAHAVRRTEAVRIVFVLSPDSDQADVTDAWMLVVVRVSNPHGPMSN